MNRRATTTIVDPKGGDAERTGEALRQPNDRDESSTDADRPGEVADVQRAQMERARRDAESPQVNTDCHSTPSGEGGCSQPRDPSLLDDVLAPGDPTARDAENRRTAQHDPGAPSVRPDGRPAS
ncbi:MAG TPA: hypothetical protein VEA81_01365 [Burkholderiaceae bacterium]|nr:hypothetical protein [Burkholderiaceae bacterium]